MTLTVEWLNPETGPEASTFESLTAEFMTEPSGALLVFEAPGKPWAAFGAGVWTRIHRG